MISGLSSAVVAILAGAALCACDSSKPVDSQDTASVPGPHLGIAIDPLWQGERLKACVTRMEHFQTTGVWKHGGAAPGVARDEWNRLSDADRTEIFQVAACIGAVGKMEERSVTVSEDGGGPVIETRTLISDSDFSTTERDAVQ